MLFVVTVKLAKDPSHNPRAKQTRTCRLPEIRVCTDATGEHHSLIVEARNSGMSCSAIQSSFEKKGFHVTRVERVDAVIPYMDILREEMGIGRDGAKQQSDVV